MVGTPASLLPRGLGLERHLLNCLKEGPASCGGVAPRPHSGVLSKQGCVFSCHFGSRDGPLLYEEGRSLAWGHGCRLPPPLLPRGPSSLLHLTASSAGRLGLSPGPASQDAAVHFLLLLLQLPGSPRAAPALGSEAQPSGARSPRVTLPEPVIPTPQRWHSAG